MITDKKPQIQPEYLYKDLTYKIIGCLYGVHRELGSVHKEVIYHKAMAVELKDKNIAFTEEKCIDVKYKGKRIGAYKPDFILEDKIILEIKVVPAITKAMQNQVYYYVNCLLTQDLWSSVYNKIRKNESAI